MDNDQRQFEVAIGYHRQALDVRRTIGDQNGEGISLYNLAIAFRDDGDYEHALQYLAATLDIQRCTGNRWMEINVLNELAITNQELGQFTIAHDQYEQAISVSQAIGDESGEAFVLSNYGTLLRDQALLAQAFTVLHRGLAIVQNQNVPDQQAYFFSYLSSVVLEQGDLAQARHYAQTAIQLRQDLELDQRLIVNELVIVAQTYLLQDDLNQALQYAHEAYAILQAHAGVGIETPQRAYYGCAKVFSAGGLSDLAQSAYQNAAQIVQRRAEGLDDPLLRESFLQHVPLNALILQHQK